jgi:hypothetical protein
LIARGQQGSAPQAAISAKERQEWPQMRESEYNRRYHQDSDGHLHHFKMRVASHDKQSAIWLHPARNHDIGHSMMLAMLVFPFVPYHLLHLFPQG